MKLIKYPHSCFVIEKNGKKILIDFGSFMGEEFPETMFFDVSALLITHTHRDHLNPDGIFFLSRNDVPIYGNFDVVRVLKENSMEAREVKDKEKFSVAGFEITPVFLPHCKILKCELCGGWLKPQNFLPGTRKCKFHPDAQPSTMDGPPNTGFVIDGIFFHPGDGIELKNFTVKNLGVPITGPTITYENAWEFAASLKAKLVIPMHYDNPYAPANDKDPKMFEEKKPKDFEVEVRILKDGESVEVE